MVDRTLTAEEQKLIWATIMDNMAPDDRYPYEVIGDSYNGDIMNYLVDMGYYHNILKEK